MTIDRHHFKRLLREACRKHDVEIHASAEAMVEKALNRTATVKPRGCPKFRGN